MREAINKAKFVQATHYVVGLQSAEDLLFQFHKPSFLCILRPLSTKNSFVSFHKKTPFYNLKLENRRACFHFDFAPLLERFKFEPHISPRHDICIFDISQDLGFSLI